MARVATTVAGELLGDGLTVVEVGVRHGENAVEMLACLRGSTVYLVDDYRPYVEPGYCYGLDSQRQAQQRMLVLTAPFGDRARPLLLSSVEAARIFAGGSLDFVYLDAQHDVESVREDLAAWWPKVRAGGMLAGHDYDRCWPGVIEAVNEFAQARSLALTAMDGDWWVVKAQEDA